MSFGWVSALTNLHYFSGFFHQISPSFSVTLRLNYFCQNLFFSLGELKTNPLISSIFAPLILQQPPSRTWLRRNKALHLLWEWNSWSQQLYKEKVCLDSGGASSGNTYMLADLHRTRDKKHACGLLWSLGIDDTIRIQPWRIYLHEITQKSISKHHRYSYFSKKWLILYFTPVCLCMFVCLSVSVHICVHAYTLVCEMPAQAISSFGTGVTGS